MPTPWGHALGGLAVAAALGGGDARRDRALALGAVAYALAPDLDFLPGFLGGPSFHHYATHSLGASAAVAVATYALARWRRWPRPGRRTAVLAGAYLSHLGLDLLGKDTTAPFGIQLWWPFADGFVIAPVAVFDEIRRGSLAVLFGAHNWIAAARETLVLGPAVALASWWRRLDGPAHDE